ncbi:hypothetical protein GCM10010842_10470 [Deinococcus daejeonensis]|uniref:Uncharacterized protein n=1 Tax=Deinococcus daejeonensis TaxID=1007098 RepID=A0ABQ2IXN3_9DEIO|nr:hypothetical protein GCM10010842_10470 [Deinococcus daejeonensis]
MLSTVRSESFQIKGESREWERMQAIHSPLPTQGAGVSDPRRTVTSAPDASG